MRNCSLTWWLCMLAASPVHAQRSQPKARVDPQIVSSAVTDGRVRTVYLASRFATVIRMHEPVNSVVLGDPGSFSAEHSDQEPNLVFVKPITTKTAQSNLLISTSRGHQAGLLLISRGELDVEQPAAVDFIVRYWPAGRFLIEPADYPAALVAETADVAPAIPATGTNAASTTLEQLLERQRKAPLPELHGGKPGVSDPAKELIKAGVSEVIDQGREVMVLFSVVNPQNHAIELMPPQIQLGGKLKSKWVTAEQYPIAAYRLSRRRIGAGERADGVVVFNRPPYKQSNETLFLQVAESGGVDRPALAPIGFGISTFDLDREGPNGKPTGR